MKQMHWGHGLIIFFGLYISYLIITVVASTKVDHHLVVDNYYDHDIAYQERYYDVTTNRDALNQDLLVSQGKDKEVIALTVGEHNTDIEGVVLFYRPSDKNMDVERSFKIPQFAKTIDIPIVNLQSGLWRMKIRWSDGVLEYYKEEDIVI